MYANRILGYRQKTKTTKQPHYNILDAEYTAEISFCIHYSREELSCLLLLILFGTAFYLVLINNLQDKTES